MSAKVRIKTPITYYGGKQLMAKDILPLIPDHEIYVEPFFGGGAILFAKNPSKVEVINDINKEVTNFYDVLVTQYPKLLKLVMSTMHSRSQYEDAKLIYENPHLFSKVKRAWAFWVTTNQGWGGKIGNWGYDVQRGSKSIQIMNKKLAFGPHLSSRLSKVQIECSSDAGKVITSRDRESTFFYLDTPYINSYQGHYDGYTEKSFVEHLNILGQIKGKFLLSSYPNDALTDKVAEHGWYTKTFDKSLCVGKDGARKIEMLTANYVI